MLEQLIEKAVEALAGLLFPKAPTFAITIFIELFQATVEQVGQAREFEAMTGPEKRAHVVAAVVAYADEAFDDVPTWGDISEKRRDRIIGGLAELALFILEAKDDGTKPAAIRRKARRATRRGGADA